VITIRDLPDHDGDLGDHHAAIWAITMAIPVATMRRSGRSRCGDLGGHDHAVRAGSPSS